GTLTLRDGEGEGAPLVRHDHPTLPGDYLAYYQGVAAAIRDKAPLPVGIDDALRCMALLEAGLDSHRQRRWIPLKHHL
ncbi:MAG: Gfo/Idh/MocA family oxidoreductase, partial [Halomonas aquamarina]